MSSAFRVRLKSALAASWRVLDHKIQHKRFVGVDRRGNEYYHDTKNPRRRWVEYTDLAASSMLGDVESVPMTWHCWMRHGRVDPPGPAEIEAEYQATLDLKRRVMMINARDARLRMQEIADRHMGEQGSSIQYEQHGNIGSWQSTNDTTTSDTTDDKNGTTK